MNSFDNVAYSTQNERVRSPASVNDLQNNLNQRREENIYTTSAVTSPYLQPVPGATYSDDTNLKTDNLEIAKQNPNISSVTTDKLFVNLNLGLGETNEYDDLKGEACGGYDTIKSTDSDLDIDTCVSMYSEIGPGTQKHNNVQYDEVSFKTEPKDDAVAKIDNVSDDENNEDEAGYLKSFDLNNLRKDNGGLAFTNNYYQENR